MHMSLLGARSGTKMTAFVRVPYTVYWPCVSSVVRDQSYELTRGPPELVQHFRLQGEFTSAQERCMS